MVSFAGCLEPENPLGRTCSSSWNRLVRTRMLGGVGRVPGNGHPYPITPVMGIGFWGLSPLCEIGISRRSVYQLTTSREQALGEGNRGRSNAPPRQADPTRQDSQRSVAHGQDDCEWCRYDECLVILARCLESEDSLGKTCSSSWNRLVRTRMLGGVGRTVSNGRPYPISPMSLGLTDRIHA